MCFDNSSRHGSWRRSASNSTPSLRSKQQYAFAEEQAAHEVHEQEQAAHEVHEQAMHEAAEQQHVQEEEREAAEQSMCMVERFTSQLEALTTANEYEEGVAIVDDMVDQLMAMRDHLVAGLDSVVLVLLNILVS